MGCQIVTDRVSSKFRILIGKIGTILKIKFGGGHKNLLYHQTVHLTNKMSAASSVAFSALWGKLDAGHAQVVEEYVSFWRDHGVPARKEPNLAHAPCFLQPSFWGPWALVVSGASATDLGSYIVPGPTTTVFCKLCRLHGHLHAGAVGRVLDDLEDRLVRLFLKVATPFVHGALLGIPGVELALSTQVAVQEAREEILRSFRGSLKPKDLQAAQARKERLMLFGKQRESSSLDDETEKSSVSPPAATQPGTSKTSHGRQRRRNRLRAGSTTVLTGSKADKDEGTKLSDFDAKNSAEAEVTPKAKPKPKPKPKNTIKKSTTKRPVKNRKGGLRRTAQQINRRKAP